MTDRREFIRAIAGITAGLYLPNYNNLVAGNRTTDNLGDILPLRKLGNTGVDVTMLGLGGYHIGNMSEKDAQETIETAIEGGVRFFDSAEGYADGLSEQRYGKYLTPKYREQIFLMTKTEQKTEKDARESLEKSLKRLNSDYLDLWQMHSLESEEDVDERISGGVLEVMLEAKSSGKVKHIGFTGHATPFAHSRMLAKTDIFETCQMPINVLDPSYKSFILNVFPVLVKRNMGILVIKSLGDGGFFKKVKGGTGEISIIPDLITLEEALHFVWSLPVSVLITGPDNAGMLKDKIEIAKTFYPMDEEQRIKLIEKVSAIALLGEAEDYKYG